MRTSLQVIRPAARLRHRCLRCVAVAGAETPRGALAGRTAEYLALASCAALLATDAPTNTFSTALLALEAAYCVLHAWPLLPLLGVRSVGADAFLAAYTRAGFFASELALLALLWQAPAVREGVPAALLAAHAVVHAGYVAVSAAAPGWTLAQNSRRVRGAAGSPAEAVWQAGLNAANAADLAAHLVYASALASALEPGVATAAAGAAAAATCGALAVSLPPLADNDVVLPASFVAVVTGAGGAIGSRVAMRLAAQGATVVALARNGEAADAVARRCGGRAIAIGCDLGDLEAVRRAADIIDATFPDGIHLLVANAALARWGGPATTTTDGLEEHFGVCVAAHHLLASRLAPALARGARTRPTSVLVVASAAASWPAAETVLHATLACDGTPPKPSALPWAPYAAAKLGTVAWARAAEAHYAPAGVSVRMLHPGVAPSGLQRHMGLLGEGLNTAAALLGGSPDAAAARVVAAALRSEAARDAQLPSTSGALAAKVWAVAERSTRDACA